MDYYNSDTSYIEKRSIGMAIAAMVMGIAGLAMSCCIYPAIIFGIVVHLHIIKMPTLPPEN